MRIYEAINQVMKDCGFIGKDSINPQQKYKFRGIDAVMNALNPALIKNRVFVMPEVLDQTREERQTKTGGLLIYSVVRVKYTFYADDGSSVSAVVVGEGMDSGDKATNKAMSAAFKYACFQTFCIPTEEMRDSEEDSPEPAPRNEPDNGADRRGQGIGLTGLDANAYFHVLCTKIAEQLHQTITEVKNDLIAEWGQPDQEIRTIILDDAIDWRKIEHLHLRPTVATKTLDNGRLYRVYIVMRGSHTYDKKEMSRLIDGAVDSARELGIETMTPDQIERMKNAWTLGKKVTPV